VPQWAPRHNARWIDIAAEALEKASISGCLEEAEWHGDPLISWETDCSMQYACQFMML
jgi:hypothetical protein